MSDVFLYKGSTPYEFIGRDVLDPNGLKYEEYEAYLRASQGYGALTDILKCEVHESLNGEFEIEVEYPMNGRYSKYLKPYSVIKCATRDDHETAEETSFLGDRFQPFRVYRVEPDYEAGIFRAYGQHLTYDMHKWIYLPERTFDEGETFQAIITSLRLYVKNGGIPETQLYPKKFRCISSVEARANKATQEYTLGGKKHLQDVIFNGSESSPDLLDIVIPEGQSGRGTLVRDYKKIEVQVNRSRKPPTNPYTIDYGQDLKGLNIDVDYSDMITHVIGSIKHKVQSSVIDPETGKPTGQFQEYEVEILSDTEVPTPSALGAEFHNLEVIDLTKFSKHPTPNEAYVTRLTKSYIKRTGIGAVKLKANVDFVPLWQTNEWKYFKGLRTLRLGDPVKIQHPDQDISIDSKVYTTSFDALTDRYLSMDIESEVVTQKY